MFKYKNKFYKFHPYSFLYLILKPVFKKTSKDEVETKSGPSPEFIFAVCFLTGILGLLMAALSLAQISEWTIPISILAIIIAVGYGLIRGTIFMFKWIYRAIRQNIHGIINIYKKLSRFKIVFYKIGNRWL